MRIRAVPIVAGLALVLAACGETEQVAAVPREPGPDATGFYCSMTLAEHQGPKGQVLLRGLEEPFWFSSVRDALTYVGEDIAGEQEIAGFWVHDMAQGTWREPAPGSWIDARAAWFVVGSGKEAAMGGSEAIPFKDRTAAERFASAEGGTVADYAAARLAVSTVSLEESGL